MDAAGLPRAEAKGCVCACARVCTRVCVVWKPVRACTSICVSSLSVGGSGGWGGEAGVFTQQLWCLVEERYLRKWLLIAQVTWPCI